MENFMLIEAIRDGNRVNIIQVIFDVRNDHDATANLLAERNNVGDSPIICAIKKNYSYIAQVLIGLDNTQENYLAGNKTALMYAAEKGNLEVVRTLINKEIDHLLDLQDNLGNTALMYAARIGDQNIFEQLIIAGANVNIVNNANETAIDIANANGHNMPDPQVVLDMHALVQQMQNINLEADNPAPPADLDNQHVDIVGED